MEKLWITPPPCIAFFSKRIIIEGMSVFIEKLKPADIIALVVLTFSMYIISTGVNHIVSGVVIMICTYYFVKKCSHDYK